MDEKLSQQPKMPFISKEPTGTVPESRQELYQDYRQAVIDGVTRRCKEMGHPEMATSVMHDVFGMGQEETGEDAMGRYESWQPDADEAEAMILISHAAQEALLNELSGGRGVKRELRLNRIDGTQEQFRGGEILAYNILHEGKEPTLEPDEYAGREDDFAKMMQRLREESIEANAQIPWFEKDWRSVIPNARLTFEKRIRLIPR